MTKNAKGPTVLEEYEKAKKTLDEMNREREERKRKVEEAEKRWKEAQKMRAEAEREEAEEEARWQREMRRKAREEAEREKNFGEDRAQREWAEEQEKKERAKEWERHERRQREEVKIREEWLKKNAKKEKEEAGRTQTKAGFSFMNWTRGFHSNEKEKTEEGSCHQNQKKEWKIELSTIIERIIRSVVFKFGSCVLLYVLGNISFKAFFSAILTLIYFFLLALL